MNQPFDTLYCEYSAEKSQKCHFKYMYKPASDLKHHLL
jgi:hypothetical protein